MATLGCLGAKGMRRMPRRPRLGSCISKLELRYYDAFEIHLDKLHGVTFWVRNTNAILCLSL
jgi:hypothetical protein